MNINDLPQRVRNVIMAVPTAGGGVNNWLYRAALVLHNHWPPEVIAQYLSDATAFCGRHVSRKEIERAVRRSGDIAEDPIEWAHHHRPRFESTLRNIPLNHDLIAQIEENPGQHVAALADLWEESPWHEQATDTIIDRMFPADCLLCCGKSNTVFATRRREVWRGRWHKLSLMVPSPMLTQRALTDEGKLSEHTLAGTGDRHYLIVEFDIGDLDQQARHLWYLCEQLHLILVVHSGSKSLHGWFYCRGVGEERLQNFMRLAVSLGADPVHWNRSQFTRVPGGFRDNGVEQCAYYFNPYALDKCHASPR